LGTLPKKGLSVVECGRDILPKPNETDMKNETPSSTDGFILDIEFQSLLPPLSAEDFESLEKSILADGCRDALITWQEERILVDGYNRYAICKKHGLEFKIKEKSFANRDEVIEWMFGHQKSRRNMNKFLWAEAILKRKSRIAEIAKENQRAGGGSNYQKSDKPVHTLKILAKLAGISHDTMNKVNVILTIATANPQNVRLQRRIEKLRKGSAGVSINSVHEGLQELVVKKKTKKSAVTKSNQRSIKSASIPATSALPQDIAGHIIATLDELAQQYPDMPDRIDLINMMSDVASEWAHKKKIEIALSQKK
jgi:hypothetical protein